MKKLSLIAALVCAQAPAADWLTNGGDPQRTNWQRDEHVLNTRNVQNMKLLWKVKLDNQPREMHSLFPPLIVTGVNTDKGIRDLGIVAGISDNIFAVDSKTGEIIWSVHFDYPPPKSKEGRFFPGDPLCPGGQTATPVIGPADADGKRTIYALAGDGSLHWVDLATGRELRPAVPFGYPNAKAYALNLWKGVVFTTTAQSCNDSPNQVWAMNVNDADPKPMTFSPRSGGLWGREGAAIDSRGVAWAPTGDGRYDPQNFTFGNGLIGVEVVNNRLQLEDYFIPKNWSWLEKRDLDMQVTPAIFPFGDRELLVTGSKACSLYLLDTRAAGGEDHQTPLAQTPQMCNEELNFASAGIWGALATWQDEQGARWVLTPFWGPVHPKFAAPVSNGSVEHGAIVAWKIVENGDKFDFSPEWISRDMNRAEPPLIANGIVFAYGSGENTEQAYPLRGLYDYSPERIKHSGHAVLYALDAKSGKELWSSGDQIASWLHFGGLTVTNGRVYIGTYDSVLYCFGID